MMPSVHDGLHGDAVPSTLAMVALTRRHSQQHVPL
jgi:hypothetical protein